MGYSYIIEPVLAQGSFPVPGTPLHGIFDTLVLCAVELQYPASMYPGVTVLHVPLDDTDHPTPQEIQLAIQAGENVAARLRAGQKVLSTCAQGRNRSGEVDGVALVNLGMTAHDAVQLIQARRRNALTNTTFVRILELYEQSIVKKKAA